MRALALCLGIGILLTATCGGSSSSTTGTDTGTGTGTSTPTANGRNPMTGFCSGSTALTCTGDQAAYEQCILTYCNASAVAAFGPGYASGSFAGACGAMMSCQLACPCDATANGCELGCVQAVLTGGSTCMDALLALRTCYTAAGCVTPSCTPNTTGVATDTSTSSSTATLTNLGTATATYTNLSTATATGGCAAAAQCCATLAALGGAAAAQAQQECATVTSAGEAACNQVLGMWQASGFCK